MIRGAVHAVDLGAPRGHEQGGKRYALVVSPTDFPLSVATIVPTSTSARPTSFRPQLEIAGRTTVLLVDQIRSVDVDHLGDFVDFLDQGAMAQVNAAVIEYLGLV